MIAVLGAVLALASGAPQETVAPVLLQRKFAKGEVARYVVTAFLSTERRGEELATWMPEEHDIRYSFTTTVRELRPGGFAAIRYERGPFVEKVLGIGMEEAKKFTEPAASLDVVLSPVNAISDIEEVKKPKPGTRGTRRGSLRYRLAQQGGLLNPFIEDLRRLALFVGIGESGVDFSPKLNVRGVRPGDTWKQTVSFQPQKVKGEGAKQAVQRLDVTYTYVGTVSAQGGKAVRVEAALQFENDLLAFAKQLLEVKDAEVPLTKIPVKMEAKLVFDLDPATLRTRRAEATSVGGFGIFAKEAGDTALYEERFKGRTTLVLQGVQRPGARK